MVQTPKPADAVRVGQVFLGKYQVESVVGQGGMGVVVECTHLALNERVALKMLRQDVMLDHDAVERFMREAQAAARLKSEYVARVSDVGALENGTPYMVMEFLEGQDLGQLLDERKHLPVPWATELMLQTAEALAEAHSLGIVHRDVKPSNLFVTWRPDGTALVKVLDFGISKSTMTTDMHLTQTQSLLGTPAYMSPEQMRSARHVDARTDIWSLGSVMYELIEGRKPFEAESFSEMCVKVAVDPPAPMHNAPPELQQVVMRCLAKNPDQRYASMADLGRDLIPFAQDPQQAAILVERMQRMLRRSLGTDWGDTTGTGRVPRHVRDQSSSPVRSTPSAWAGGSEPSGAIYRTPVPGALEVPPSGGIPLRVAPGREASAPATAPSEVYQTPRRRSRFGFVLLGAALVGITSVALAVGLGGGDDERAPSERAPSDPAPTETAGGAPTDPKPTTDPVDPTPPTPPTATQPAAGSAEAPPPPVDPPIVASDLPEIDMGDPAPHKPTKPSSRPPKKPIRTGTKTGTKTIKKDPPKEVVKEPKDDGKEPVTAPKCDPFASRTGCKGAKAR